MDRQGDPIRDVVARISVWVLLISSHLYRTLPDPHHPEHKTDTAKDTFPIPSAAQRIKTRCLGIFLWADIFCAIIDLLPIRHIPTSKTTPVQSASPFSSSSSLPFVGCLSMDWLVANYKYVDRIMQLEGVRGTAMYSMLCSATQTRRHLIKDID